MYFELPKLSSRLLHKKVDYEYFSIMVINNIQTFKIKVLNIRPSPRQNPPEQSEGLWYNSLHWCQERPKIHIPWKIIPKQFDRQYDMISILFDTIRPCQGRTSWAIIVF